MLSKREWEQTCLDGDGWLEHFPPIRVNRNYHLVIYGAGQIKFDLPSTHINEKPIGTPLLSAFL